MHPRRAGALALGFSLAGVVLVLVVVGVAARVGPSGLTHGKARDGIFQAPTRTPTPPSTGVGHPPKAGRNQGHGSSGIPDAALIRWLVRTALVVWLLWLLVRGLVWLQEELAMRRNREPPPVRVEFDVLEDPEPLLQQMQEDADQQLELLLAGEPRNGIVACWERFEEQAERVGLARRSWETSSEFTLRLLDGVAADPDAVSALAALYREARFSEHAITETHRDEAISLLQRIRETVVSARLVR